MGVGVAVGVGISVEVLVGVGVMVGMGVLVGVLVGVAVAGCSHQATVKKSKSADIGLSCHSSTVSRPTSKVLLVAAKLALPTVVQLTPSLLYEATKVLPVRCRRR